MRETRSVILRELSDRENLEGKKVGFRSTRPSCPDFIGAQGDTQLRDENKRK